MPAGPPPAMQQRVVSWVGLDTRTPYEWWCKRVKKELRAGEAEGSPLCAAPKARTAPMIICLGPAPHLIW